MLRDPLFYIRSISRYILFENTCLKKTFLNAVKLEQSLLRICVSSNMSSSTLESRKSEVAAAVAKEKADSIACPMESINSDKDSNTTTAVTEPVSVEAGLSSRSLACLDDVKMQDSRVQLKRKEFSGKTKKGKKLDKHPKKIPKFSNDEKLNETTYYFENGLRKVTPYVYVFETHIKGRWMGRSILDVFKGEFRMESPEYYKKAIGSGLITINSQKVSTDKILYNNEFLRSMVHRHEPPVTGEPLDIITINEEFVVINKPASVPVHPCGKYRHNTILFMLGKDHGLTGLHTIHRLDRLTSGLLMFARTREVSQRVDAYVRDRKLNKVYVCKVAGEFPSELIDCVQPIYTISHKIGVCRVSPDGKHCKTAFKRLSYDGQTSIVQCVPHTGRMHQIRVHLQYMGYPIVNDPLYNNPAWGPKLGKDGDMPHTDENEILAELIKQHTAEMTSQIIEDPDEFVKTTRHQLLNEDGTANEGTRSNDNSASCSNVAEKTDDVNATVPDDQGQVIIKDTESSVHYVRNEHAGDHLKSADEPTGSSYLPEAPHPLSGSEQGAERPLESGKELTEEELHRLVQRLCKECKLKLRDPKPEEMIMYLHALSYKGPGFDFSTPLPNWAEEHIQRSAVMKATSS